MMGDVVGGAGGMGAVLGNMLQAVMGGVAQHVTQVQAGAGSNGDFAEVLKHIRRMATRLEAMEMGIASTSWRRSS